jgi:flagellar basal body P-ring formation protein FlgA
MQMRRQARAGQALRVADLAKPDLVQRDDNVTLIYESSGLYLTIRGKAMENGTEGDVINVTNLQSKRTVSGVVIGRGQIAISVATPRLPAASDDTTSTVGSAAAAPVSVASSTSSVAQKAE